MANGIKLVILGDGGVGKTSLVRHHLTGQFNPMYLPTLGVEVTPIVFNTNKGVIKFNIWDTAGQEKYGGHQENYLVQAKIVILMHSDSKITYRGLDKYVAMVKKVAPNAYIIICNNKADIKGRKIFPRFKDFHHYDISVLKQLNLTKLFLDAAQHVFGSDTVFV